MGGLGLSLGFRARWKLSFTLFRCKVGTERCIDSPSTLTLLLRCQYYGYSDAVECCCCGPGLLFYVCFQLQSKALPISCLSWIMIRFLFLPSPSPAIQILRFSGWGKKKQCLKMDTTKTFFWISYRNWSAVVSQCFCKIIFFCVIESHGCLWFSILFHKLLIAKKVPTLR